jgi:mRNA interferase MazF
MNLVAGEVVWITFRPGEGREQHRRRPAVVIASTEHLDVVDSLMIVVPVTTRDRGWVNHVQLSGDLALPERSWAMTEQVVTLARDRIHRTLGVVDAECLARIRGLVGTFLGVR